VDKLSAPKYWRIIPHYYRLEGTICKNCGYKTPLIRKRCPNCGSDDVERFRLPREGEVYSYTVIYSPPEGFERHNPYIIGLIKLKDGTKILGQIVDVDPEEVRIGLRVRMTFRRIAVDGKSGIIQYGYKFKPVK